MLYDQKWNESTKKAFLEEKSKKKFRKKKLKFNKRCQNNTKK